ncbi:uncharacterized protein DDB_G0284459-like isoform X1 [Argiope bruennichi]|uniref:uncharacterized protein DDB_G0284459-like isoform X1 n=1 Tax=Argiope bruennichi TaxID=94029 RepID=UPI002493E854|nr:uncharacterized protein DDB_G0284459-like isoform X1 [Argiope bruennichi]
MWCFGTKNYAPMMTEHLNGHTEKLQNGFHEFTNGSLLDVMNGPRIEDDPTSIDKVPRKKVSFHDAVTDIDGGNDDHEEKEDAPSLDGILNVSEKISFFNQTTKAKASLGQPSSIPQARLAFVTEMVQSSSPGNESREDREEDREVACRVTDTLPESDNISVSEEATDMATQVTFMKIFATPKKTVSETVVDTSSILEHREETRDFWEKRMMADDNQSSPSSTIVEKSTLTQPTEEGKEEAVVKTNSEAETKHDHKMSNGFAKSVECNGTEDGDAKPAHEEEVKAHENETQAPAQRVEADHDNNNCIDSLEPVNTDDYVEEKTYTSELETSLVMKQPEENPTSKGEADTTQVTEQTPVEEVKEKEILVESETVVPEIKSEEQADAAVKGEEQVDAAIKVEEHIAADAEKTPEVQASSTEKDTSENDINSMSFEKVELHEEVVTSTSIITTEEVHHQEEVKETTTICESQPKSLEVEKNASDDDDGFVRVEECLPKVETTETEPESFVVVEQHEVIESSKQETKEDTVSAVVEEHQVTTTSSDHDEHSASTPPASSSPEPKSEEKVSHPEIEQFVKSGGVKRILPGVQKTEQPYSTCTTETKIAMEIREMREREEELRLMREQNLLSPVVSPVPPKSPSPRSPSPAMKEGSSPTPPPGCGYKVSSVFGHKGTVSPVSPVEEDKKSFKGFNKESQVEKEIRLAREREEELRNQKGLPPREDDSYVKPSQVKSSQVRVFGKMAGTSNTSVKQAATAKIQMEIEEQTQREMALRESGSIKTISQERTDAKVAKLNGTPPTNGNAQPVSNGNGFHSNGRASPDVAPYKRGSPSPTGGRPATIFSPQSNGKANISMHKFIASKGKETTFTAPRKEEIVPKVVPAVPPAMVKLKRNVSVESKIQQEILEMKQREEELKKLHSNRNSVSSHSDDEKNENEVNQKNNLLEYENGNGVHEEELSPRHNKLIAQWEQRIQKAES